MTLQQNIEAVDKARHALENHCLCFMCIQQSTRYVVQLPPGYQPRFVSCPFVAGKAKALNDLMQALEHIWQLYGITDPTTPAPDTITPIYG